MKIKCNNQTKQRNSDLWKENNCKWQKALIISQRTPNNIPLTPHYDTVVQCTVVLTTKVDQQLTSTINTVEQVTSLYETWKLIKIQFWGTFMSSSFVKDGSLMKGSLYEIYNHDEFIFGILGQSWGFLVFSIYSYSPSWLST